MATEAQNANAREDEEKIARQVAPVEMDLAMRLWAGPLLGPDEPDVAEPVQVGGSRWPGADEEARAEDLEGLDLYADAVDHPHAI